MLQALIHKKLKDSFNDPHFHPSEDSLTSSVIGLLQYLPDDIVWMVLKKSCGRTSVLPDDIGAIRSINFWDRWNPRDTGNSLFVEPDVWIDTDKYDIIIEAKKYDSWGMQHMDQWENEIKALKNEHEGGDEKEIVFIALGGNESMYDSICIVDKKEYAIHTASWFNLLNEIVALNESSTDRNVIRLTKDIIHAFSLHGFFEMEWLDTLESKSIAPSSAEVISNELEFDNHSMFRNLYRPHNSIRKHNFSTWKI